MKIFIPRYPEYRKQSTRTHLEFSGLLCVSSTVIMLADFPYSPVLDLRRWYPYSRASMQTSPYFTIQQIAQGIRSKEFSPVEIVDAHFKRIDSCEPKLNAFVHLDREAGVQAFAAESPLLRGGPLGALHGVPLTVKSCIDVAGWPCPAGSVLRMGHIPRTDAPLVARLKAAGAILLGNTNTPEFLMAYETNNLTHGKTSNPWSLAYSAGGSSGGEAAAIASGCSAGGVGSDGGGSIRVPAHFCGICGMKPTPGRIPSNGHYPPGNSSFGWLGVVGPMARTVGDLRALFGVLRGADAGDALTSPVRAFDDTSSRAQKVRIGILEGDGLGTVTPETQMAVRKAAQLLAYQGFVLEPFRLNNLERVLELWWFFFGTVISELFQAEIRGREASLTAQFCDYLKAARSFSPE